MPAPYTTLISADELAAIIDDCVIADCRYLLMEPGAGARAYAEGHLPRAWFVDMDTEMAGAPDGSNGRHPLPDRQSLRERLSTMGLRDDRQLVAYDAQGSMPASRLWWLARWLGHEAVAVLDGGIDAWRAAGFPLTRETPADGNPATGHLSVRAPVVSTVAAPELLANIDSAHWLVVDARAAERYRGEIEPIDPIGGHIPGAINRPYQENLRSDGRFKPAQVLRSEFLALLAGRDTAAVVHQCGSGVSACHNLLAMAYAELDGSALYPGSWSEWCSDRSRPVATGSPA